MSSWVNIPNRISVCRPLNLQALIIIPRLSHHKIPPNLSGGVNPFLYSQTHVSISRLYETGLFCLNILYSTGFKLSFGGETFFLFGKLKTLVKRGWFQVNYNPYASSTQENTGYNTFTICWPLIRRPRRSLVVDRTENEYKYGTCMLKTNFVSKLTQ